MASKRELILLNGEKSVGTIYDTHGEYLKCRYQVDNVSLVFGREVPYQYLEDGEQYEIKFLSEDPEYIVIEFDKPILSDEFVFLDVTPKQIEKVYSNLRFKYAVNDHEYTRLKFNDDNQSISTQDYVVKFRMDNPQIGYLMAIHQ